MISSFTRGTVSALLLSLAAAAGLKAQAPAISATKSDNLPAGTKALPGATVTYTNTVTNSGVANATGVTFADPDVAGSAVQGSTLRVSPIAFDDSYTAGTVAANTSINTNTSSEFSVTTNDYVGMNAGVAATISITTFDANSANGGKVTMVTSGADMGKFTYAPAPGYVGTDTFTYTITNNGSLSNTGVVSITVAGPVVWYVSTTGNDTTGNGSLDLPFATVTKAATVDASGHKIFVATGTYAGTAVTLETNEVLVGQGAVGTSFDALVLGGTPSSDTPARPVINGTRPTISTNSGSTVTLANNNTILGLSVSNGGSSSYSISGTGINTAQIGNLSTSDVTISSSGTATGSFFLSGGNGIVSVNAPITTTAGRSVTVTGRTGSSVAFTQEINDTGRGISLTTNTGAAINFSGGLSLSTGTNAAFTATGGGTVTATQNNTSIFNSATTTTGTAVNLNGVTIGASGLTLRSLSSSGAANGIKLVNVACGSPGLSVVGDDTGFANGSGGSISNTTGASLGDAPVHALTCSGTISLKSINMSLNTNCFSGMLVDNNAGSTLAVNVTGCTFIGVTSSVVQNKSLLQFEAGSSANVTANVQNSYFSSNRTYGCFATGAGTSVMNVTVNQCGFGTNVNTGAPVNQPGTTITNPPPFSLAVTNGSSAQVDYNITNNTFWGADGSLGAIYAVTISGASTTGSSRLNGSFNFNKIGKTGVTGSGAANGAGALGLLPGTQGAFRATVLNNDIRQVNSVGINFFNSAGPGANSSATLKVKGNTLAEPDTTGSPLFMRAIVVTPGNSGGANNPWIAEIGDTTGSAPANRNTISDGGTAPSGPNTWQTGNYIRVTNNNNTSALTLPGLSPTSGATAAQVNAFVQAANTLPASSINSTVGAAGINGGAALPLLFAPRAVETSDFATPPDSVSSAIAWTEAARERHMTEPTLPQMASAPEAPAPLMQEQLDTLIIAARERWVATGLNDQQRAALGKVTFELADLPGWYLGEAAGKTLRIDRDAGGNGWFIDATPMDDGEFAAEGSRATSSSTRNRVDLLTTILHEMGHGIGLCDTYSNLQRSSVMYGFLTTGERRLPAQGQAIGAMPHEHSGSHFLTGTINIGVLPPGKSVTIIYDVVVNNPPTTSTLSSQATVSGGNFANVLTDDRGQPLIVAPPTPAETNLPGAADPTVTLIELPDVNLAVSPTSVLENGAGTLTYTFTRQGATAAPLTVSFAASGTAAAASDYTIASGSGTAGFAPGTGLGTLIIPIGQASATLTLSPTDDLSVEADETATLTVVTGTAYDVGVVTPAATGTITNDDTDVSVAVAPSSVSEDGATNLVYTFTRTGVTAGALTVNFNVSGTATLAGSDYTQTGATSYGDTAGSVTFAAASSTATVTLNPTADNTPEADVGVTFTLVSGAGYTAISPTAAIGTIANDDSTVTVAVVPAATAEDGATNLVYTFTRTGSSTSALTLNFNVSGTATLAGSDYAQTGAATYSDTAGTISIPATASSATVTVNPTTDTTAEQNETVILTLAVNGAPAVTGGYTVGAPSSATGTISDDDLPQVSIVATTPTAVEGGATGLYTLTRTQTAGEQVVNFQLDAGSTATAGSDFTLSGATSFNAGTGAGTITFADTVATATVTLTALVETLNGAEAAETAQLNVATGSGYLAGSPANATVTIGANSFLVTDRTNDHINPATGSLRQAVLNANANPGADTITFDPTVFATKLGLGGVGFPAFTGDTTVTGPAAGFRLATGSSVPSIFSVATGVTVNITGLTFQNAYRGIENNGTLNVSNCRFDFQQTAGIQNNSVATVTGCTFNYTGTGINNGVSPSNSAATLDVSNSTFEEFYIAAIANQGTGTLSNCAITTGDTHNMLINATGATLSLTRCSITGYAELGSISNAGTMALSNCTVLADRFPSTNVGSLTLKNTIYLKHPGADPFTDGGGNLVRNGTDSPDDLAALGLDPAGLQNNGGPVPTIRLLSGSPAINSGSDANLPSGLTPVGRVDIGAFEHPNPVDLVATTASAAEGTGAGTTAYTFTVTRPGATTSAVTMNYTITGTGTNPANAADFGGTLPTGTLTLPIGVASDTIVIQVSKDTTAELAETFTLTLSNPTAAHAIAGSGAVATITNDDNATVGIAKINDGAEATTPTPGKFRVTQTAASSTDTTVAYTVTGTATSGTDFTALSSSVTIPAGQTTADIDVTVLNEGTTLEPTKTVILTVNTVTSTNNVTLGTPDSATLNLTDDDTATVTLAKITDASESPTSALFRVTQTAAATVDTVITYSVSGTATSGSDFTAPTGSVTILAGETNADISVAVANDAIVETTETIALTLTGFTASDADVSLGTTVLATADLIDNDAASISIARINDGAETNSPTAALFRVSQTAPSSSATTVSYAVTGSAVSGNDFAALSGSVSIPAGSTTADINVTILNDAIVEATETITVTLTGFTLRDPDITLNSTPSATAAIVDVTDNDLATVSITKITDGIESASPTNALFRVTQSAVSSAATVIAYTTSGTATSGSDFTALSGSVTIPASSTSADITATILNENVVEASETVSITLNSITSGDADITLLAPLTATADITDSDTSIITLAAMSADQNEGTGGMSTAFTFSATLSNPVQGGFTIGYTTADGTALASSDYLDNDSDLSFTGTAAESQTITVQVRHDDANEIDEAFTVTLGAITNTTLGGSISLAGSPQTGTIRNDDAVTISIAATDATADENTLETGTYRLTRNGVLGTTTVQLDIESSNTAVATDWTQTGATFSSLAPNSIGTIVIPDGQSFVDITLTPTADLHAEADETVRLNIAAAAAYTVGSPANATVTIGQNDFVVINTNDAGEGTLRQAVLNANAIPGTETITFDTAVFATPRTITLTTGQIVISSSANVQGTGADMLTLDGNDASRIFNINSGASIRLSDLAVTNGNHSTSWGGAINVVNGSNVTLLRTIVSNSISQLNGGGIYVSGSTLNVVNSTISGNTATTIGGGAISTGLAAVGETINIINSTISGNTGPSGGAMQFGTNPSVNILHSTITNNTTTTSGGSVTLTSGSLTLSNSIIAANVNNTTMPDVSGAFTSAGGNLIGNVGAATGLTAVNDFTGTGTAPVNPLLGALTHNGGPTLTHAVLNGSRAINNGLVANLPTDTFDLDGDLNVIETLPVDQRGGTNLRQRGPAPDSGAVEAFAFEPTLTAATTNEDTQNTSGLVITANTADGGLTTHYKITGILNGTLFKNNGTTTIQSGSYITKAEGLAGLKFTPAANLNTTNTPAGFGFTAQAAVGISASDERGTPVPVTVTVNALNDAPTVVSPGLSDRILTIGQNLTVPLTAAFTDIEGDLPTYTVQTNSDGSKASAVISQDSVNLLGLASGTTSITILADDGQGGTITDTFLVSVGTVNPTPLQIGTTATLNRQNGLFELFVNVTNTTPYPINGFRLRVNYNAYKAAHPSLILYNASSPAGASDVYLDYRFPVPVNGVVQLNLSFYTNNRRFPSPFVPGLSVESLGTTQVSGTLGEGVQPTLTRLPDRSVRLEFITVPGKWYRVRYSADLINWFTSELPVQGTGNLTPWIDKGPPYTNSDPAGEDRRFYIINEFKAP